MTNEMHSASACPDVETLAMFIDGRIPRSELAPLVAHIEDCEECMATLEAGNEVLTTRRARFRARWWMAAAAAAIVVAIPLSVFQPWRARSPMDRLVRLVPETARPSEARLSGGFEWAAYRGPMRAEDADADPRRMQLIGAAGELVAAADRERSADAQQAAGIALVVTDRPLQAVERLRAAVQVSPNDAAAWSDLAAAQYAAALRRTRPSMLPEALVSADRALRIAPRLPEARFNRALILERLGLSQQARAAWEQYLEVDPASAWATEARQRLSKIGAVPADSLFRRDLPRIERAADAGDAKTLDVLLGAHAQHARAFAEAETLGRWAEAASQGRDADAARELRIARTVGAALVRRSGESLLHEAVRAIDSAATAQRAILAGAHAAYRRGRIAYSRNQLDAAREELARAASQFEEGESPMQFVTRYYAANVRFDQNDAAGASQALRALLQETSAHSRFIALAAQMRWELALCFMVDGDWSGALPLLEESRDAFRRLEERNHQGFVESLLADTLLSLGRPEDAWAARIRAFTLLSADGGGDRLPVSMKAAAQMELRGGRLETARAMVDLERAAGSAIESDFVAADALIRSTLVNTRIGDREAAGRSLREAEAASRRVADRSMQELARAHVQFATAATLVSSDAPRAEELLGRAIELYRSTNRTVFLPECHLLRARAALHRGDRDAAADDLENGIALLERSPVRAGAVVGTGMLDAGEALFDEAIRLSLDRGDVSAALAYAERSRGEAVSAQEIRKRLGTSGAAVLQLIALPDELVAICVTAGGIEAKRHPLSRSALDSLVAHGEETAALGQWYGLAIRPFEVMLADARQLIVVADRAMDSVPFAALYDSATKQHLVQRMPVSRAIRASALHPSRGNTTGSLLAVALPSGDGNAGLPETSREVAGIAALYPHAVTIEPDAATFAAFAKAAADANVIHIAGHTQRQPADAGSALLFARERVTFSTIAARSLPRAPIVVLAACETRMLGDGFLAAGATDVIATLTPIADADARELFHSIHSHLAAGASPSVAVQRAQLEALARNSSAWRAVTSMTRSIPAASAATKRRI